MSRSPETLGDYKALAHLAGWTKAEAWLDKKIAEAARGPREPVIADDSQFVPVLLALEGIGNVQTNQ